MASGLRSTEKFCVNHKSWKYQDLRILGGFGVDNGLWGRARILGNLVGNSDFGLDRGARLGQCSLTHFPPKDISQTPHLSLFQDPPPPTPTFILPYAENEKSVWQFFSSKPISQTSQCVSMRLCYLFLLPLLICVCLVICPKQVFHLIRIGVITRR